MNTTINGIEVNRIFSFIESFAGVVYEFRHDKVQAFSTQVYIKQLL